MISMLVASLDSLSAIVEEGGGGQQHSDRILKPGQ